MQQQHELNGDIEHFLQSLNNEDSAEDEAVIPQEELPQPHTEQEADEEIQETIHVYFVREEKAPRKDERIIEHIPSRKSQRTSDLPAYITILFFLCLPLSCLTFQLYLVFNPPIATVTIIPQSQTVTLNGTVQLGRLLNPITISQSQTVSTTGHRHQTAEQARGYITFYNGQFQMVTIAAGTILTGSSGVQIITDQDAPVPEASPPTFGQITVSAHAVNADAGGNIPAYDVSQACCAPSVLAKNRQQFTGGQNERTYQTVAQSDITNTASPLRTALTQSLKGALQGQLQPPEQLSILPCTPHVTSDHPIGEEATLVKVTISQTCSAVAFNTQAITENATMLLTHQAIQRMGTGYSLIGSVQVSVKQATITGSLKPLVFLSFHAQGTWVYALNKSEQQHIETLITSKTTQEALHILQSLKGVENATISWGNAAKLPKDKKYIHIRVFVA